MKNKITVIFIVTACLMFAALNIKMNSKSEFDLSDYSYMIETFPSDCILGKIENARDAKLKAKELFQDTFSEKDLTILYQAGYDKNTDTWLVSNNKTVVRFGGSAYVLIKGLNGEVMALWHDK